MTPLRVSVTAIIQQCQAFTVVVRLALKPVFAQLFNSLLPDLSAHLLYFASNSSQSSSQELLLNELSPNLARQVG